MDIRTLLFADLVLQGCCAAGMWLMSRNIGGLRGLRWFAASYASIALGLLGIILGGELLRPLGLVFGRSLMLLGLSLLWLGVAEFVGRGGWKLPPILAVYVSAVAADAACEFLGVHRGVVAAMICATFASLLLWTGWLLWREPPPDESSARHVTAAILAAGACLWLFRAVRIAFTGVDPDVMGSDSVRFAGTVAYMVYSAALAFGLVWMVTARLRGQLEDEARTDGLTGVLNRRALEAAAEREMAACRRRGTPLAILALDLDHFKGMNDAFGHAGGDTALCAIAELLVHSLRRSDLVSRFGGEEFVVVLPDRDAAAALEVAERLRHHIEALGVPFEGGVLRITASFGVATLQGPDDAWEAILRRADRALYAAKQAGRNCALVEPLGDDGASLLALRT